MGMDRRIERRWFEHRRLWWMSGGGAAILLLIWLVLGLDIALAGTVQPIRTVYLDAMAGGRVEEVIREAGTYVTAGDTILRISNAALVLDIMNREAQLFEQRNNLRNTRLAMQRNSLDLESRLLELERDIQVAQREFQRNRQLLDRDLVPRDVFIDARQEHDYLLARRDLMLRTQDQDSIFRSLQIEMLEASVDRLETGLCLVRENLENLWLRAPVSGHLTSLNAEIGESKTQGERLGQIDVLDGFRVRAEVDEYYIARIAVDRVGTFELEDREHRLRVTKIYPEVTDGRFQIDLVFVDESPPDIRRGQTLRVQLQLGDRIECVVLPRGGFYTSTSGRWVYVLDDAGRSATRRDIRLGRQNPRVYEVLDGLAPGERVVISPYDELGDANRLILKN